MTQAVLLTGGTGQVGTCLRQLPWPDGVALEAPDRAQLDLADADSISAWLKDRPLAAVINAGAYTAVDKAESDIAQAWKINAIAPAVLGHHAAALGIPMVHVSTDYVFDGRKQSPYVEDDAVAPLGVYGASKEGGEQAVRSSAGRHVILRTSWVVSPHGSNFVKTMLRLGAERSHLRIVADQHGAPTSAGDLAATIQTVVLRQLSDARAPSGTYHYCNAGETTWFDLARHVFDIARTMGRTVPSLEAIATADYPTPARRPTNSRLRIEKVSGDFGLQPRPWQSAVHDIVAQLLETRQKS